MKLLCWNCGESLDDVPRPISRHAACSACFNELHCCRLCQHYDHKRNMQCFEDRADPPLQKENANFCEFFSPTPNAYTQVTTTKSNGAKSNLNDLFGGSEDADSIENDTPPEAEQLDPDQQDELIPKPHDAASQKLDNLFK